MIVIQFLKIQSSISTFFLLLLLLTVSGECNNPLPDDNTLNSSPTAISLSLLNVSENQAIGTQVATFSTTDSDADDNHSYSLVSGEGASGNNNFTIKGTNLITNAVFDFETQNIYSIRVQSDDGNGGTFQMIFSVKINDIDENSPPTIITLSDLKVSENVAVGTLVGILTSIDPNADDTHSYSLATSAGNSDNAFFSISKDSLLVAGALDYESDSTLIVRIQSDDGNRNTLQMTFDISVINIDEHPPSIMPAAYSISEFASIGDTVGQVLASANIGIASYRLVSGNITGAFKISDDGLITVASFLDFETLSTYTLGIEVRDKADNSVAANFSIIVRDTSFQLLSTDNVSDNGTLKLSRAISVSTAVVSGTTYLFVAGFADDGISVFSVAVDGTLTNVDNISDSEDLELDGIYSLSTAIISGTPYLFGAGFLDNGISIFSVDAGGTLTNVDNISDNGTLKLDEARSISTIVISGITYLFVAGSGDNGVSVFSVAANGTLMNVDNISDNGTLKLSRATSVSTAVVSGMTYLFVSGLGDDGISVFSVAADETLMNVDNVSDNDTLELDGVFSLSTAVVSGTTYLFVVGNYDDGISVFSVASDGTLINVDNISDNGTLALNGSVFLSTAVLSGITYLFVSGLQNDGISIFSVATDGSLINVASIFDNETLKLDGARSVSTAVISGATYLFVAGLVDSGVSVFRIVD